MKWVVVAIIAVIVPYTFLTLYYRKPGKAFEPYHDMQDRANTLRLLSAGFQRVSLAAARPADPIHGATVPTTSAPGGVPDALRATLVITPLLPAEILSVSAAPSTPANAPYATSCAPRAIMAKRSGAGCRPSSTAHACPKPGSWMGLWSS